MGLIRNIYYGYNQVNKSYIYNTELNSIYQGSVVIYGSYNESMIAIIELDSNDEPTDRYNEYDNIRDAALELLSNPNTPYMMRIGDNCTFMDQIPDNVFNYAYASSNFGVEGNYNNLHKLYVGSSRSIGTGSFQECDNLNSVVFKQIASIGNNAFLHCSIEELKFPSTLVVIQSGAFAQQGRANHVLRSIEFNDGIKALISGAFTDNDSLHYVRIPGTLISGGDAFNSCNYLEVIKLDMDEMPLGFNLNGNSGCGCVVLDWDTNIISTKVDANGDIITGHPEDVVHWDTEEHLRQYINGYSIYGTTPEQQMQIEYLDNTVMQEVNWLNGQDNIVRVIVDSSITEIPLHKFDSFGALTEIIIHKSQDSIPNAPWGATNATITWTG